jgi:hypothetical protein
MDNKEAICITTEKSVSGRKHQLSVRIQIAYVSKDCMSQQVTACLSKELPASTRNSMRQQELPASARNCMRRQGTA